MCRSTFLVSSMFGRAYASLRVWLVWTRNFIKILTYYFSTNAKIDKTDCHCNNHLICMVIRTGQGQNNVCPDS